MEARYYLYKFKDHLSLIHCHHFTGSSAPCCTICTIFTPFNLLLKAMLFNTLHLQTKKRDHAADTEQQHNHSYHPARRRYESLSTQHQLQKREGRLMEITNPLQGEVNVREHIPSNAIGSMLLIQSNNMITPLIVPVASMNHFTTQHQLQKERERRLMELANLLQYEIRTPFYYYLLYYR